MAMADYNGKKALFVALKGEDGQKGEDGKTPVKGVDYFTEADKASIVEEVTAAVNNNESAIPGYVVNEAEDVIDRVLSAQGTRTFTFAAITDMHYGNNSYTDGVQHAIKAMKYIDERIKLDAVVVLGDYVDSYPASALEDSISDFKAINKALTDLRFAPNIRVQGNHDYYAGNGPINRRFIQSYSDNVVWGSKTNGYFYRDFEDFKLRIIALNTTEIDNANIGVSIEQYQWFADSLDLSNKSDAAEWQILIVSHHPLDWYVIDGTYRFAYILEAYKHGTSGTVGDVTYNFTGKNSAVLIGTFHGHIHNFLIGYLNKGNIVNPNPTEVLRMCTPEACIDRANHYGGDWSESDSYNKVKGTAKDTSFCIYCIDLDSYTIKAICYGAGYDREVNYVENSVYYTITNNLTSVTSSNNFKTIGYGSMYYATLTAVDNKNFSVTVTMNGVDITDSVYSNGIINIYPVTGNIVITAIAESDPDETSSTYYTNQIPISIDSDGSVYNGKGYIDGRRINSSFDLTEQSDYYTTGYIPVKTGDTVYMKNVGWNPNYNEDYNAGKLRMVLYDKNFVSIRTMYGYDITDNLIPISEYKTNANGDIIEFKINDSFFKAHINSGKSSNACYLRLCSYDVSDKSIITVNEPIPSYTNQIPISIDTDGSVYNGKGYKDDYRLNSSGAETALTGTAVTGFIPVNKLDVIRLKNIAMTTADSTGNYIHYYDSSFTDINGAKSNQFTGNEWFISNQQYDTNGNLISFIVGRDDYAGEVAYIRVSCSGLDANSIITVNESITD